MLPFRDIPIQRKLLLALMGVSLTGLVLAAAGMAVYEWQTSRTRLIRVLTIRADVTAANIASALVFNDQVAATQTLVSLQVDPHMVMASLYDADGHLFAEYRKAPGLKVPQHILRESYSFSRDHLVMVTPVLQDGKRIGSVRLIQDEGELHNDLIFFSRIMALLMVTAAVIVFLVAKRLENLITGPILTLARTAREVGETKNYARRAAVAGDDEIGHLAESFNGMLAAVQQGETDLRRSEEALRQLNVRLEERVRQRTTELETANKELESFSYSVSHDLRAPLRAVNGFCQLLLEDYGPKLDASAQSMLHHILASVDRMRQLIDDMLSLAQVSRAEFRREAVDFTQMVHSIADELQAGAPSRKVGWVIESGVMIHADRNLLRVAMDNLLGNAWKYTSKQPQPRIEFGTEQQDGKTVYYVRDNGAGFDMAYAAKLFRAFQRLHRAEEFPGTGIGLATVARIIGRHGGRIWAEAAVNQGATFKFTLA